MSEPIALFATCPRGVEPLLLRELESFGATDLKERPGGIAARGDLAVAYRACLWSRLASRVLMPMTTFELVDADSLYTAAQTIVWPELFDVGSTFAIEVAGHSPQVTHTHYAGLKIKDAIVDGFRAAGGERPNVDTNSPDIRVHLHLDKQKATLSLDLAGDSLHRRGYRARTGEAPLKENLAAAILVRAGWPAIAAAGGALIDPMCGSGTLVIEAGLIAADIAPGLGRERFGFEAWRGHQPALWKELCREAGARKSAGLKNLPPLLGSDIDGSVLRAARQNAELAGLGSAIEWREADLSQVRPVGDQGGLVVTNPPYGERLGAEAEIIKLYSLLGATLKSHFAGWHASIFTGRPDLGPRIGLRTSSINALYNGALPCKLLNFELAPAVAPSPDLPPKPEGGEDFANRLRKNLKHLAKWAKREGVQNYRVYDADLPDYALAVDLYQANELQVHVQEYAAPKTVDPVRAEKRLREALSQLQNILEVPTSRIHYKLRRSQKGTAQYQKMNEQEHFLQVEEHGAKLWVNFEDYLDTGLFLDHRPIRQRIQQEALGKRFLNLFCYTASVSAHAAVGGARSTTSVDLSKTYLEWAQRNLLLNGFRAEPPEPSYAEKQREPAPAPERRWGAAPVAKSSVWARKAAPASSRPPARRVEAHQLVRADCLKWLRQQAGDARAPKYDLILCDPPTFSNSKKMEEVLDTQRDHVELIRNCMALLAPGGKLYFSTNRRRFKLDEAALAGMKITDITWQTLGEDYKRPPPAHFCWQIEAGDGG